MHRNIREEQERWRDRIDNDWGVGEESRKSSVDGSFSFGFHILVYLH